MASDSRDEPPDAWGQSGSPGRDEPREHSLEALVGEPFVPTVAEVQRVIDRALTGEDRQK